MHCVHSYVTAIIVIASKFNILFIYMSCYHYAIKWKQHFVCDIVDTLIGA